MLRFAQHKLEFAQHKLVASAAHHERLEVQGGRDMSEEVLADDQSHYEVSLTAGQAFLAFVLLLLSLAASFAFGLMIGRGQADERLVVKKEPAVVTEASVVPKKNAGKIVELGV